MNNKIFTIKQLKEALNNFDENDRIHIDCHCYMDFGLNIRQSKDIICCVELGQDGYWSTNEDDYFE